jgi:hypothetical protein
MVRSKDGNNIAKKLEDNIYIFSLGDEYPL